ncbi:oxidoreductase activity protein [[Candida] boidinii]|uniref:Unnamed protein product n=1 Tax=Candida boidinii TaxID=5477 RepID=A0ACB5TR85_CANBO|nr:oxidoreductase activity protein [[Candida] boidinii]OWB59598.1 oxidoreductase activity protein [[Candida] boidinii]OWB70489.1 oxidoreductase activity protein [[Candida] boidinii]OWB80734.1 oxidoreductase activity protein [[Candida] boidinii]GME93432.1 unnamed protein product [[Candida] boidinii]
MTSGKKTVLFIGDLNENLPEYIKFKQNYNIIKYYLTTKEQFVKDLKDPSTKLNTIDAIYAAWMAFVPIGGLNEEIVDNFPDSLKLIVCCSAGFDKSYLGLLTAKGIHFCNTPTFGADDVADTVLYHTLISFRNYPIFEKKLREMNHTVTSRVHLENAKLGKSNGKIEYTTAAEIKDNSKDVEKDSTYAFGHAVGDLIIQSPSGRNAVIVGFGAIGKKIGRRLSSIGMNIYYVKRTKLTELEESELGYKATMAESLEVIAPIADIVILAVPGGPETNGMINKSIIDKLPSHGSRLVNVGRGTLIVEKDVIDGLKSGKLLHVGLDVFSKEPFISEELIEREDVSFTPHIGSSTVDTFDTTAKFCLNNIDRTFNGEEPLNMQN